MSAIKLAFVTNRIRELLKYANYHGNVSIELFANHLQIYRVHQIHPPLQKFPIRKLLENMANFKMYSCIGYTFSLKFRAYFDTW